MQIQTALDLRKTMAQKVLTEQEYLQIFKEMPEKEQKIFWGYYENPAVNSPESFIQWLKRMGVLQ